jgi:hypothetical protein
MSEQKVESKNELDENRILEKLNNEPLKIFVFEQQGICLIEFDYQIFKDNVGSTYDFYYIKASTTEKSTKTVYYLIDDDYLLEKWNKVSIFNQNVNKL